jgi:hypothetical protein
MTPAPMAEADCGPVLDAVAYYENYPDPAGYLRLFELCHLASGHGDQQASVLV